MMIAALTKMVIEVIWVDVFLISKLIYTVMTEMTSSVFKSGFTAIF